MFRAGAQTSSKRMPQAYRSLAVARATTTNNRRLALLIAFTVATSALARFNFPTSKLAFSLFALWIGAVLVFHFLLNGTRSGDAADRIQVLAFVTDITFLTLMYDLLGGAWWLGGAIHSFIVTFAFASVPRRRAGLVAAYAIISFVGLVEAQALGWVTPKPFLGVPPLTGNYELAVIVVVMGLIPLVASAAVQNTFVRIMRRAQERHRLLLQTAPDMIVSTDTSGKIVSANAAAVAQTGRSREELIGKPLETFLVADDKHIAEQHHRAALSGESRQFELRYLSAAGESGWLFCTCNPIREDDRITGVLLIGRDVSQMKENEAALRESGEKLRQAQKMEAIGRLAGSVAHDFSNLLTVIDWHSQFALDEMPSGDPRRDDINEIRKASALATNLTRQLLAFSRKQILQPRVLDLNEVVVGIEKLLQTLIGVDVNIVTRLAPDTAMVQADPGQLEQVVMNLCINARDAMKGGGTLTIETANAELPPEYAAEHPWVSAGKYAMLAVSDTGEGMDEATKAHIFEPFFTTKEAGKGTGLGLATVYGIIKQSGGSIEVYSEKGKGTSFKIYFPAISAASPDRVPVAPTESDLRGTETILLVEDTDAIRGIAHRTLTRYGYTVLVARNGPEALSVNEHYTGKIHLLLTDMMMPDMTGRELAKRLQPERKDMKLLFMSGYTEGAVLGTGPANGAAFIGKPFTPEDLTRRVKEVLLS
jgi:two-component system cell cycle sensor histidine kinase/response regulator CckA